MENVINQYPDLDMEEIAIILNKSYSELESSTTSEEFDSILRKNGITDNTFYIKDMSDIRNVNIIVSTSIIGVMSVLFIICFCMYLHLSFFAGCRKTYGRKLLYSAIICS